MLRRTPTMAQTPNKVATIARGFLKYDVRLSPCPLSTPSENIRPKQSNGPHSNTPFRMFATALRNSRTAILMRSHRGVTISSLYGLRVYPPIAYFDSLRLAKPESPPDSR